MLRDLCCGVDYQVTLQLILREKKPDPLSRSRVQLARPRKHRVDADNLDPSECGTAREVFLYASVARQDRARVFWSMARIEGIPEVFLGPRVVISILRDADYG